MLNNLRNSSANNRDDVDNDRCACTCAAPNGMVVTIVLNVLLWMAVLFSSGAVVDCHLVEADIFPPTTGTVPAWPALPDTLVGLTDGAPTDRRGFGFLSHEDADGDCRWEYDDDRSSKSVEDEEFEDYIRDYLDWMGKDWRRAARIACTACLFGLVLAIAATVYFCVAHVAVVRYASGLVLIVVLMPLQFGILSAMNSDFCKDRDCKLQRSGHFAIAAAFLYVASGIAFFFFRNYAGNRANHNANVTQEQAPQAKVMTLEEATHQDDYAADYGLETVEMGDGMADAQEIKPAQIY